MTFSQGPRRPAHGAPHAAVAPSSTPAVREGRVRGWLGAEWVLRLPEGCRCRLAGARQYATAPAPKNHSAEVNHTATSTVNNVPPAKGSAQPGTCRLRSVSILVTKIP